MGIEIAQGQISQAPRTNSEVHVGIDAGIITALIIGAIGALVGRVLSSTEQNAVQQIQIEKIEKEEEKIKELIANTNKNSLEAKENISKIEKELIMLKKEMEEKTEICRFTNRKIIGVKDDKSYI